MDSAVMTSQKAGPLRLRRKFINWRMVKTGPFRGGAFQSSDLSINRPSPPFE